MPWRLWIRPLSCSKTFSGTPWHKGKSFQLLTILTSLSSIMRSSPKLSCIWSWITALEVICLNSSRLKEPLNKIWWRNMLHKLRLLWKLFTRLKSFTETWNQVMSFLIGMEMPAWQISDFLKKQLCLIHFVEVQLIWLLRCFGAEVIPKWLIGICWVCWFTNAWQASLHSGTPTKSSCSQT